MESLALTRNAVFPRRSKKLKEKDNSIFQPLPVILRGIEGLCGDLLYIAKSLKKYCCQELYSQLRNKQLTVCRETPSSWKHDVLTQPPLLRHQITRAVTLQAAIRKPNSLKRCIWEIMGFNHFASLGSKHHKCVTRSQAKDSMRTTVLPHIIV